MSLQLLTGSPVSDNIIQAYRGVIELSEQCPGLSLFVLVPEQASLTVQETFVSLHPRHALSNIDILTFEKLSREVFKETMTETKDVLDDLGKMMLERLVISENTSKLKTLGRSIGREGMLKELNSVISELAEYNISPETLEQQIPALSTYPALRDKLNDLTVLYRAFLEKIRGRYDMAEERLVRLAKVLPNWSRLSNSVFLFDGFTGFTPPEYEVLSVLIRCAKAVSCTVTLGSDDRLEDGKPEEALFHMSYVMSETLKRLAIESGVEFFEKRCGEPAGASRSGEPAYEAQSGEQTGAARSEEIRFVEKALFRDNRQVFLGETDRIRVARLSSAKEEVRFIVSEILSSVRNGMRFRDIAVVSGDPSRFDEEIAYQFGDANIPFFIDESRSAGETVLCRFLLGALEVSRTGFGFDATFGFLKSPIVERFGKKATVESSVFELENYALSMGIRSEKRFRDPWERTSKTFTEDRLGALNETKEKLLSPLFSFHEVIGKEKSSVSERIEAVRALMEAYEAKEGASEYGSWAEKETSEPLTQEYEEINRSVDEFLTRAEEILSELPLSKDAFRNVMKSGLSMLTVGRVPAVKDRVVVGDLKRTRLGAIKKLIVIGGNYGIFPKPSSNEGLVSDADREILKDHDIVLSGTAETRAFDDRFYLYLLFTRPTESLIVTYAAADEAGKPLKSAMAVGTLCRLFPDVLIESPEKDVLFGVNTRSTALETLSSRLSSFRSEKNRALPDGIRSLYRWFVDEGHDPDAVKAVFAGLYFEYRPERLKKETAEGLYGSSVEGSVTRLERFAGCPCRHFLQYGLGLKEREEYRLEKRDIGSLLHNSLECFFMKLKEKGLDWRTITESEQEEIAKESVFETSASYGNEIMQDSERNRFLVEGVRRVIARSLWALKKQWEDGEFTETKSEVVFDAKHGPSALSFTEDGRKVRLEGRIDRIDTLEEDGQILVKIIDYKSSPKHPVYAEYDDGRQIQLFLYLKAAIEELEKKYPKSRIIPAGVYYFYLHDPIVEVSDKDPETAAYQDFRLSGLTSSDLSVIGKIERGITRYSNVVQGLSLKSGGKEIVSTSKVASEEELRRLADGAVEKAKRLAKEIGSGRIETLPYKKSCKYCEYRSVCGFDEKLPGYRTQKDEKMTLNDVLEKLGAPTENDK